MTKEFLFSFKEFVDELRDKSEKNEIIENYEAIYGPLPSDFKETDIYKQYVSKFIVPKQFKLIVPSEIEHDFDWVLLEQLTAASFSSEYWLEPSDDPSSTYNLYISVSSGGKKIVKKIEDLWSFQILRLFEIYIDEQIKLFTLMADKDEDESEHEAVSAEQQARLKKYRLLATGLSDEENFFTKLDKELEAI